MLGRVDFFRLDAGRKLDREGKARLGQYLTPASVARLMASMFEATPSVASLLDAGAGVGTLFAACVAELCSRPSPPEVIRVTAYEIDPGFAEYLADAFRLCEAECGRVGSRFEGTLVCDDFIAAAVGRLNSELFDCPPGPFNGAILNPPYRKIHSASDHRRLLRSIGVETSNLYTAFLAAAVKLLAPGGQLVAITPRSFCNGSYFRPFREFFLRRCPCAGCTSSSRASTPFGRTMCSRRTSSYGP